MGFDVSTNLAQRGGPERASLPLASSVSIEVGREIFVVPKILFQDFVLAIVSLTTRDLVQMAAIPVNPGPSCSLPLLASLHLSPPS